MYRYTYATLYAILTVIISYPVFRICNMLCRWIREALIELFPRVFHDYSPVLEIREYESAMLAVTLIASVLSLFIVTMIVTRLDNERDEFIIRKTEGFYRITGVMPLYYRTYILPDSFRLL